MIFFRRKENIKQVNIKSKENIRQTPKVKYFTELLEQNDFLSLKLFKKNNQEILENNEIFKGEIFNYIIEYFKNSLKNPEEEDFDNIHKLVDSNILPLEYYKKNIKLQIVLEKSLEKLLKEKNMNGVSRIKNLLILSRDSAENILNKNVA